MSNNVSNSHLRTDSNQGALQSGIEQYVPQRKQQNLRTDSNQGALQSGIEQYVPQRKQQPPQNRQQPRRFTVWN